MNIEQYLIIDINQCHRSDKHGRIVVHHPIAAPFKTIDELHSMELPVGANNRYWKRQKSSYAYTIIHKTDELEIIDPKLMFPEYIKDGYKFEQHIGDGEIITAVRYPKVESEKEFYARLLKEYTKALDFWSHKWYETRFHLPNVFDMEQRKEFTLLVLHNLKMCIECLSVKLKELN